MAQSHIVFLIDINSIHRDPVVGKESPSKLKDVTSASTEIFPASEEVEAEKLSLQQSDEQLEWLSDFVLSILHKEAKSANEYDYSKVQWCFKFFDSSHHVDFKDGRTFMPFDYESFENFEKNLKQRFKSAVGSTNSDFLSMSQYDKLPIQYLSDTIKIITGSLSWPESQTDSHSRSFTCDDSSQMVRNAVYVFFRVPRTEKELMEYADLKADSATKVFMKMILPEAFSNRFHFKLRIQLNFVDMWTAPQNACESYIDSWNGEYPKQILKCVQYLSGGKVIPIPMKDFADFKRLALVFGFVPYLQHLRTNLKRASQPNENLPLHISRLADKVSKGDRQKTSPDFETASSINRSFSLRSSVPSVLDSSINIHSKLRQFGIQRDDDDRMTIDERLAYPRQIMANIKAQDLARERKRKRMDTDYEYVEDYAVPGHSRRGRHSQSFYTQDPVEVDSLCEKEQRLENWVNDGVFSAKRKKHLSEVPGSSVAVSMSRPALMKNSHTFQEPAPKASNSRGQKMLATVERQKLKVNSFHQKRRSSEGMDTRRMLQQQEVELSSLKRRLNIQMAGELGDDNDAVSWMRKFNNALRSFCNMILSENNPNLVPLAQALVNYASRRIIENQSLLERIRDKFDNDSITSKDLLEELLLSDFTTLNKKIIQAHESPSSSRDNETTKALVFREAELQIILRVEIAWCFVAPNEDATEKLLTDIVRLLQIIAAYRTQGPVTKFINTILLPNYIQGTRFMRELYTKMNIPIPFELSIAGSPVPTSSKRDDDSSMISSTSSVNLCPEDSASQLNLHEPKRHRHRHRPSLPVVRRSTAPNPAGNKTFSGSRKGKRPIMVATSNPNMSSFFSDKADSKKGNIKISPKRVRRNLFDVQKNDKKDSKTLVALSSSRLTKSPAFKSPKRNSPSGFFRAARNRKQLTMSNQPVERQFGSPTDDADVLCPESPATPGDRMSMTSRHTSTPGTTGKPGVIQESPQILGNSISDYSERPTRVTSLSFYSVGNDSQKSRAWEKSESKLLAAKIKESVDLRFKDQLTLSDLEILSRSPVKGGGLSVVPTKTTPLPDRQTPDSRLTLHNDSLQSLQSSSVSKQPQNLLYSPPVTHPSASDFSLLQYPSAAPDLNNPEIHSLITGERFPVPSSLFKDNESNAQDHGYQAVCGSSPLLPSTSSPSTLQTPSKRVQFNLNDNLVNTPASNRKSNIGTPKSILKETQDTLADGERPV